MTFMRLEAFETMMPVSLLRELYLVPEETEKVLDSAWVLKLFRPKRLINS